MILGNPTALALLLVLAFWQSLCVAERPPFDAKLQPGAECEVPVSMLHPTQFTIGWREVHMRAGKLAQMKPSKLVKYLDEHTVPIVIGPQGVPYILDHHHLVAAIIESGIRKTVPSKVMSNSAEAGVEEFWKQMRERGQVHPYDEQGNGPISVTLLPATVKDLKDDPWRSLAWAVREAGGYAKHDDIAYADFKWANFFRAHVPYENTDAVFLPQCRKAWKLPNQLPRKTCPAISGRHDEY